MSTYIADHDRSSDSTLDALAAELGAMQTIAKALTDIRDLEARHRVLSWANERFIVALPTVTAPVCSIALRAALNEDPTLSVEGLEEFFEQPRGVAELLALQSIQELPDFALPAAAAETREGGPLGMLIRGVSSGLKALVAEWQTV